MAGRENGQVLSYDKTSCGVQVGAGTHPEANMVELVVELVV